MAMSVARTLDDLRRLAELAAQSDFQAIRPLPPATVTALGLKLGFRIQWSEVEGVDGYRVAMMTTNNLNAPDYLSPMLEGRTTLNWEWFVGDVAAARQFSVQSFKRMPTGEVLFSDFRYPLVSATSKVDGGAADSSPTAAPSAPVAPSGSGDPGDPWVPRGGPSRTVAL